jgi:hypothetical protein
MLTSAQKSSAFILFKADNRPWFTTGSDKAFDMAGRTNIYAAGFYPKPFTEMTDAEKRPRLHFNDLRGTAINFLAESGATALKIVSTTGHAMQCAARIL